MIYLLDKVCIPTKSSGFKANISADTDFIKPVFKLYITQTGVEHYDIM